MSGFVSGSDNEDDCRSDDHNDSFSYHHSNNSEEHKPYNDYSDNDRLSNSSDSPCDDLPINKYSTGSGNVNLSESDDDTPCQQSWSPLKGLESISPKKGRTRDSSSNESYNHRSSSKKEKKRKHSPQFSHSFYNDLSDSTYASGTVDSDSDADSRKKRRLSNYSSNSDSSKYSQGMMSNTFNFSYEAASLDKPLQGGKGAELMGKMGYKMGEGLGKNKQGRVAPVELSKQEGRKGLGLTLPDLDAALGHWDPNMEVAEVKEPIEWLADRDVGVLSLDTLKEWMEMGPENKDIEQMTDFCSPSVLKNILSCKSTFDALEDKELRKARAKSNPFETIKGGIFLNRAAMKMANIDAAFDFMFTNPVHSNGNPMVRGDSLLYFADVCAGPGGFSEYVLWKRGWRAKGFGFTLRGDCDFKLGDFYAGPCETFETYYGPKDDGNVFDPKNIIALKNLVMASTDNKGVHFMMADGGFSVEGQENIQEILSKQLYLCQFLVAMSIVRNGGHFVCKLFDIFSPFSVGLVYLMYKAFLAVSIFKPNTSRPANSERYIVCKHKRSCTEGIRDYMTEMNNILNKRRPNDHDINICVPIEIMQSDECFFEYIVSSNNRLGERQIVSLAKIAAFYNDKNLVEMRQNEFCQKCLCFWKVPHGIRKASVLSAEDTFAKLVPSEQRDFIMNAPLTLNPFNIDKAFGEFTLHWDCVVVGSVEDGSNGDLTYYIGSGRNRISKWDFRKKKWMFVKNPGFELSPKTLVLGEIVVPDYKKGSQKMFHIIDAYSLGGEDISNRPYHMRLSICELFSKALEKKSAPGTHPIKVVRPVRFKDIQRIFDSLEIFSEKIVYDCDGYSYPAKGVLFLHKLQDTWTISLSKSTNKIYYHNQSKGASVYEFPHEANAVFSSSCSQLRLWVWEPGVGLKNESPKENVLHKNQLIQSLMSRNL